MNRPEDPCRDPASEDRDDWEDHEPNDWRRRDRDWNDYVAHKSWLESQGYHRPNRPDQVQIILGSAIEEPKSDGHFQNSEESA